MDHNDPSESKGTDLRSLKQFVMDNFGHEGFQRWYDELSPQAQEYYDPASLTAIRPSDWYPSVEGLLIPMEVMCDVLYDGDLRAGCWAFGRFSADFGLTGVYRLLLRHGPANLMLSQAPKIMSMYMRPGYVKIGDTTDFTAAMELHDVPPRPSNDYQVAAFIERTVELINREVESVEITKSISRGDDIVEIQLRWRDKD